MKVALIYDFFPHYRAAVLRELLNSPEHDYLLVGDEKGVESAIKVWDAKDTTRFHHAPCRKLFSSFFIQRGLLKLVLRKDLEAVVFLGNPYLISTWFSALAARILGKRVLFWTHGWVRQEAGPKSWLRSMFYRLSHGLLLYGHFGKMSGLAKGFATDQLYVIYNSLDYDKQREIRQKLPAENPTLVKAEFFAQPDWPMVICSARLTRTCRFDLLLEAQTKLRAEGHMINVLLVGDGPEKSSLQMQARRENLPVHFFGACYDETMLARLTRVAHVTVSPGKVGLTAMHSLAYGTPVITHDDHDAQMPEWEAILPGRTGDFFRRNDVSDLARVIKAWTSLTAPRVQTREECYEIIEKFYKPSFQRRAIDRAVRGAPADDLFWMRECQQVA